MAINYDDIFRQTQQREQASIEANQRRLTQATAIYDEIINRYRPGGSFGEGYLSQLETQKVQDVGKETQQMISSGLYGTTTAAGAGQRWEANVGAGARLKLEDLQMERLSTAQIGKAGLIERVENPAPDYGMLFQAMQAQGSGGGTIGGGSAGSGRPGLGRGQAISGSVGGTTYTGATGTPTYSSSYPRPGDGQAPTPDLGFQGDPRLAERKKKRERQTIAGMWATQDYEDLPGLPKYGEALKTGRSYLP